MADPMISRLVNQFPSYQDPGRVKEDIANVTRHVRTLFPRRGTLTLNGGQSRDLIKVEGTVATFYRGTQYNTPVEIFITENYPSSPPMCYIRPTPGMSLKVGHRHVDQSGLVYLPYLHEWAGMTHNLVELCAHMSSVFGAEPPLFTTPRPAPTPPARPSIPSLQPPQYIVPPSAKPVPDVPPRPRPEDVKREKMQAVTIKLQAELQTMYNQLRVEMDTAFETQAKLEEGREEVDADIEELTRRQNELVRLVEVSQDRCLELETYLEERKKEGEPEVDELIEPKDKLSEQMLGLVAENAALEDCLYYLDQGVTEGAITVEDFLSQVRKLARKQFVARATMKKVERAQQARNAARAAFNAQQQAQSRGAGAYPRLPPQQTGPPAYSRIGGPPPYTPSAGYAAPRTSYGQGFAPGLPAAGTSGSWRGSIRVGGAATPGSAFPYAGYNGGFGAGAAEEAMGGNGNQASSTQRR